MRQTVSANPPVPGPSGAATMYSGDRVTITIVSAECSGIGDVLTVDGPVSGTISTNACFDVGRTATFGPAGSTGNIEFELRDPRYGSGTYRVTGSYPIYQVELEDGFGDRDFNDNVLQCAILECDLLLGPTGDPNLDDLDVQAKFKDLWHNSNPTAKSQGARAENGGYVTTRNGTQTVKPFGSNGGPEICGAVYDPAEVNALQQAGDTVVGFVHTHPHTPGASVPTNGSCQGITDPKATFGEGPSGPDEAIMEGSPYPQYVMDKDHIHRLRPYHKPGDTIDDFDRNSNCAKD